MMTIGSLFSGIGGLELGLERAGLGPVRWQAESDPWCRHVLRAHWPGIRRYDDVRDVDEEAERVDILCGGFPCQDISLAGSGAGLDGARSGLWIEYVRIIRALRPRVVVVENVSALLGRGLGRVLGDLAESGYDAQWDCIPAQAVGAPHRRDRLFVVAWRVSDPLRDPLRFEPERGGRPSQPAYERDTELVDLGGEVANADGWRRQSGPGLEQDSRPYRGSDAERRGMPWPPGPDDMRAWGRVPDASKPAVCRVAYGVPRGVDRRRLRGLGNAVVPQVAEVIGRAIVEALR